MTGVVFSFVENLGLRTRSDPFVQVMVCNKSDTHEETDEPPQWLQSTEVVRNAKCDVEWGELELSIPVERKEITRKERCIRLRVMDFVDGRRHIKYICQSASVDKIQILAHLNHWVDVEGNLVNSSGDLVGRYALKIRYLEKVDQKIEYGHLDMSQIVVTHLRCDGER